MRRPDLGAIAWEIDREDEGADPIRLTLGEAIVLLNRVGVTLEEAYHERAPVEVEALLLSQIAQREAAQRNEDHPRHNIPIHKNPEGEAAPPWVDDLPEEAG